MEMIDAERFKGQSGYSKRGSVPHRAIVKTEDLPAPEMRLLESGLAIVLQLPNCRQPSMTLIGPPRVLRNTSVKYCAGQARGMTGLSELRIHTAGGQR